jgi:hypothetical protein
MKVTHTHRTLLKLWEYNLEHCLLSEVFMIYLMFRELAVFLFSGCYCTEAVFCIVSDRGWDQTWNI